MPGDIKPVRLRLSRAKGFNLQKASSAANGLPAVNVARPSSFGNPFTIKAFHEAGYRTTEDVARRNVVGAFRSWMKGEPCWAAGKGIGDPPDLTPLRGKNLACWCAADQPCHADVLLEIANA